jgi:chemotaxis regulatin CheY-phosphate phosphatase CheZ
MTTRPFRKGSLAALLSDDPEYKSRVEKMLTEYSDAVQNFREQYNGAVSGEVDLPGEAVAHFIAAIIQYTEHATLRTLFIANQQMEFVDNLEDDLNYLEKYMLPQVPADKLRGIKLFLQEQKENLKIFRNNHRDLLSAQTFQDLTAQSLEMVMVLLSRLMKEARSDADLAKLNGSQLVVEGRKRFLQRDEIEELIRLRDDGDGFDVQ